jgi:hypothetical protein
MAVPFIPALNTINVVLHIKDANADDNVNVFYVKNSVAWNLSTMDSMADAFITWFATGDGSTSYQKLMSSVASLQSVGTRDLTTQNSFSLITQTGLPLVGEGVGTAVAAGLTKSITHRTGLAGKSFRGRTFVCSQESTSIPTPENGQYDAGHLANLIAAFTPLIANVTSALATATLVVASFYGGVPPVAGHSVPRSTALLTPITSFGYAGTSFDFQRRRAPGHQRHH